MSMYHSQDFGGAIRSVLHHQNPINFSRIVFLNALCQEKVRRLSHLFRIPFIRYFSFTNHPLMFISELNKAIRAVDQICMVQQRAPEEAEQALDVLQRITETVHEALRNHLGKITPAEMISTHILVHRISELSKDLRSQTASAIALAKLMEEVSARSQQLPLLPDRKGV